MLVFLLPGLRYRRRVLIEFLLIGSDSISVRAKSSRCPSAWGHANTKQYSTQRRALEDALVLFNLQTRAVRLL